MLDMGRLFHVFVIILIASSWLCASKTVVAKGQNRNVLVLLGKRSADLDLIIALV